MQQHVKLRATLLGVAISSAVIAGCQSYQPLKDPASSIAQLVKVQFSLARNLVVSRPSGGDTLLALVSAIEGRVISASRDTLNISLVEIHDDAGDHVVAPSWVVTVARDPSIAIDVLSLDENRSAVAASVTAVAAVYVVVIISVAALFASVYHAH